MARRPRVKDLTDEQRLKIDNGVGPTWVPGRLRRLAATTCVFRVGNEKVPWFPKDAQIEHDFEYTLGGTKLDRHKADMQLLKAMQKNCSAFPDAPYPKGKLWWGLFVADAMFILLRFVGPFAYHFVPQGGQLRTLEEVVDIAAAEKQETPLTIGRFLGLLLLAGIVLTPIFLLFLIRQAVWLAMIFTRKTLPQKKAPVAQPE